MNRQRWIAIAKLMGIGAATAAVSIALLAQAPPGGAGKGKGAPPADGKGGGKGAAKGAPAPANARTQAPIDLTGYWVSLVTEDWLYRMVTPPPGNVDSLPASAAAKGRSKAWDPAKDEAVGQQCKAYGAAGLMRMPGRLNIDWTDDNTLRIRTDAGTQTREFHFTGDVTGARGLQGFSKAS